MLTVVLDAEGRMHLSLCLESAKRTKLHKSVLISKQNAAKIQNRNYMPDQKLLGTYNVPLRVLNIRALRVNCLHVAQVCIPFDLIAAALGATKHTSLSVSKVLAEVAHMVSRLCKSDY